MSKQIAYLNITARVPKKPALHEGYSIAETIHIRVQQRVDGAYQTLGTLPKICKVRLNGHKQPSVLPQDRALAWKELAGWIEHLLVFKHPDVVEGQYENRMLWEGWERSLAGKPTRADLYDWQTDQRVLEDVRPQYATLQQKLADAIGHPCADDFDALYPNEYDDIGYSDQARRAIKEMKALFESDFLTSK